MLGRGVRWGPGDNSARWWHLSSAELWKSHTSLLSSAEQRDVRKSRLSKQTSVVCPLWSSEHHTHTSEQAHLHLYIHGCFTMPEKLGPNTWAKCQWTRDGKCRRGSGTFQGSCESRVACVRGENAWMCVLVVIMSLPGWHLAEKVFGPAHALYGSKHC